MDPVAEFYKGKTVTLVVGYSAGGGYDTYARLLSRHIGKHIPGNPTVIVQNMDGAGSMLAANHLYNAAAKDGTVMGTFARGLPLEDLLGNDQVKYEAEKFNWLGSLNEEVSVCVARSDAPIKTFEDVLTTPLTVGGTGEGADTDFFPNFLNAVLGTKFDVIAGYPGGNDVLLAVERGELQGRCGWSWSSVKATRPDWVQNGFVNILVQMSLRKHPDIPDVPLVMEYAKDEETRKIFNVVFARQAMGRPYVLPPGVPAERVAAVRKAFMDTVNDPEFLAEADKTQHEITAMGGDELQQVVEDMFHTSPDLVERIRELMER